MHPQRPASPSWSSSSRPPPPRPSADLHLHRPHPSATPRTLPPAASATQMRMQHDPTLLPSFGSGRTLPPPVSSSHATRGSDPFAYTYDRPQYVQTEGRSSSHLGAGGAAKRRPPLPTRWGGNVPEDRPHTLTALEGQRRPPSPARAVGYGSALRSSVAPPPFQPFPPPLPRTGSTQPAPYTSARLPPAGGPPTSSSLPQQPRRPSSPPLGGGSAALAPPSRIRRLSQVEPSSPTVASRPPSPSAPAHGQPGERHHSSRLNDSGYRSLVRRSSFSSMEVSSTFPARPPVPSSSSTCSSSSRPPLTAFQPPSHPPALSSSSSASALSRRPSLQYSSSLSNLRALPTYSPELPLVNRPASPPKRTNFSAGELLALQTLWNSGAYYPSPTQVEELQAKTGLSWTQIRNWFANRRQRATGEEKARVVKMGRELQVAF